MSNRKNRIMNLFIFLCGISATQATYSGTFHAISTIIRLTRRFFISLSFLTFSLRKERVLSLYSGLTASLIRFAFSLSFSLFSSFYLSLSFFLSFSFPLSLLSVIFRGDFSHTHLHTQRHSFRGRVLCHL